MINNSRHGLRIWKIFTVLFLFISLSSCTKENCNCNEDSEKEEFPALQVLNQSNQNWPIKSVELVNYTFNNIEIAQGESQTFTLLNGMPGGYENIKVTARYGPPGSIWFSTIKVNFSVGNTTSITLKHNSSSGYYLE